MQQALTQHDHCYAVCLPVTHARPSSYYGSSDGSLAVTTLGNFGRVSIAHNHDGTAGTVVTDELFQRERIVSKGMTGPAPYLLTAETASRGCMLGRESNVGGES